MVGRANGDGNDLGYILAGLENRQLVITLCDGIELEGLRELIAAGCGRTLAGAGCAGIAAGLPLSLDVRILHRRRIEIVQRIIRSVPALHRPADAHALRHHRHLNILDADQTPIRDDGAGIGLAVDRAGDRVGGRIGDSGNHRQTVPVRFQRQL